MSPKTHNETLANETEPRVARPGGFGLFFVALTVIAATWFVGSALPASPQELHLGPVTGDEFAEFLLKNEQRLRTRMDGYDDILIEARAVGDQPMFEWLRFKHESETGAVEDDNR